MEELQFAIFYITHESKAKAENFVSIAMEKGWIACGNIFPIKSHYMWKSKATREDEYVSIVKTGLHLVQKFTAYAEAVHPYETPCVIHWTANANESYVKWIYNNVKSE